MMRVPLPRILRAFLLALGCACCGTAGAAQKVSYGADFELQLTGAERAIGTITIDQTTQIARSLRLRMPPERYRFIEADGRVRKEQGAVFWEPPPQGGRLRYEVAVVQRSGSGYDGLVTPDWAIFRGDDVFPTIRIDFVDGAVSRSRLTLRVPEGWDQITPYARDGKGGWRIRNAGRKFHRPTGWILVGDLGIRRDQVAGVHLAVAAPVGARAQRLTMLAMLNWNLAWYLQQTPLRPKRLLVVSGPDPLWRGGRSAPNSLFLHADMPMISEDASSPLLHEFAHVLFPVNAAPQDDWIDEGVAEYLSLRVMRETGTITPARYNGAISHFRERGKTVSSLQTANSRGAVTARAVALLHDLDLELRQATQDRHDVMELVRRMMAHDDALTLEDVRGLAAGLIGRPPRSLSRERSAPAR